MKSFLLPLLLGFQAHVEYSLTLPQGNDDIVYSIDLVQDSLNDQNYIIDWSVESPTGPVRGFSAYFDGNFYNFRNHRLQERHEQWDAPLPPGAKPPHKSAQFVQLLPAAINEWFAAVDQGVANVQISSNQVVVEIVDDNAEIAWKFELPSWRPLEFHADYNPGEISGQQVNAVYSYPPAPSVPAGFNEEYLRRRYGEAFEKYRESQFAIENSRGLPLPGFSLPNLAGGRFEYQAGEAFQRPVLLVLLDPEQTLSTRLVADIRTAADKLPFEPQVIYAASNKNPELTQTLLGNLLPNETALTGAQSLISALGVASLPTVLAVGCNGKISDLVVGLNQTLCESVIQMLLRSEK